MPCGLETETIRNLACLPIIFQACFKVFKLSTKFIDICSRSTYRSETDLRKVYILQRRRICMAKKMLQNKTDSYRTVSLKESTIKELEETVQKAGIMILRASYDKWIMEILKEYKELKGWKQ